MGGISRAELFYMRVGLGVGSSGFLLLALAQPAMAFAAVLLLVLVALAAGLATAKWLPRALFGNQLITGLRAGALACGLASLGLLVSLALASHSTFDVLARRSHLLGFQLESAARAMHALGGLGVALVLALVGTALGAGVAGMVALLAAWDKSQRAIQVIDRAREVAQRSTARTALGAPSTGQARRPTSGLPVFPVYPPMGQPAPDGTPTAQSTQGASHHAVLHDALAAWAQDPNRPPPPGSVGDAEHQDQPAPRPASDRDNWLC